MRIVIFALETHTSFCNDKSHAKPKDQNNDKAVLGTLEKQQPD